LLRASAAFEHPTHDTNSVTGRRVFTVASLKFWNIPSLLCHNWLDVRKSIQAVRNWVMRCWRGFVSGVRCRWFAYGPSDATATVPPHHLLLR